MPAASPSRPKVRSRASLLIAIAVVGAVLLAVAAAVGGRLLWEESYRTIDFPPDPTLDDRENLIGQWVVREATLAGQPAPRFVGRGVAFTEDGRLLMTDGPRIERGVSFPFQVEPSDEPLTGSVKYGTQPAGSILPSPVTSLLYRFEDGGLTLVGNPRGGAAPTEFSSTAKNGYLVRRLNRME
ncbi:hypothetical protein [Alienimonas chondri]|uniref:TIGR03067 domain-containing protein n=1 Tax=Alienimonas chondri TaxID=2681879 RepID=A0ABX1VBN1_9PLAN|nr:hypothetical protein [Alienimonas chondri]NNJ24692.1 hypothetical protein [Alienimonas chondri]